MKVLYIIKLVVFVFLFIACSAVAIYDFITTGVVGFINQIAIIFNALSIGFTIEDLKDLKAERN